MGIPTGTGASCSLRSLPPVNAVASTTGGVVTYRLLPINVVQNGPSAGRTVVSPFGAPVHVGLNADTARWTHEMIAGLNRSH